MTTQDLIQHLTQVQESAAEQNAVEEISQLELEKITGAGGNWFANATWTKSI
ncbi:hypothetical protein PTE30175_03715 [Pandoraea terrae]|uniref:Uncharacterized protein n=1 Tax=Pandoraea terrae TaxID=1537710 RepID=A0A5E4XDE9_9BURK|nr:hypothetical protein [Pandoraea terrae]VVE34222.1 hypothetical protein PTE30175_03715 [Pandoraea terrae]